MNEDERIEQNEARICGLDNRVLATEGVVFGTKDEVGMYHIVKQIPDVLKKVDEQNVKIAAMNDEFTKYKWWLKGLIAAVFAIGAFAAWLMQLLANVKIAKP